MIKKYDNVCFVTTIYALFLYLLHSDLDKINNTLFIFSDTFPKVVGVRLPSHLFLKEIINKSNKIVRFFYDHPKISWLYYKYIRWKLFRNVNRRYKLYAQDHLYFSSTIIGRHEYTLIEDAKNFFSQETLNLHPLPVQSSFREFIYGPVSKGNFGRNKKCIELLTTSANIAYELRSKRKAMCDIHKKWGEASKAKKDFINTVFGLNEEMKEKLDSFDAILFTQNIYFYHVLSKEEQVDLYRKVINKYSGYKILIKPHPIDEIEYEQFIDNVSVWRNELPIPSQLLSLVGIKFKKYITLFSSAVNDLEPDANIDWYGTEVDEKLARGFGVIPVPLGVNICKL